MEDIKKMRSDVLKEMSSHNCWAPNDVACMTCPYKNVTLSGKWICDCGMALDEIESRKMDRFKRGMLTC